MEEIEYLSEREKGRGRKKENAVCVYECVIEREDKKS